MSLVECLFLWEGWGCELMAASRYGNEVEDFEKY